MINTRRHQTLQVKIDLFSKMTKLCILLVLAIGVRAVCSSNNYETAFGGYANVHSVDSVTFAVEPASLDMVVAGQA